LLFIAVVDIFTKNLLSPELLVKKPTTANSENKYKKSRYQILATRYQY